MTDLFVGLDAEQVHACVAQRWDLSGPFPVPKPGWMRCRCGSTEIQARYWKWHRRDPATVSGRCDLHVKCCTCSEAWVYGIAVPDDYYRRHTTTPATVGWRDVKAVLEGDDDG